MYAHVYVNRLAVIQIFPLRVNLMVPSATVVVRWLTGFGASAYMHNFNVYIRGS